MIRQLINFFKIIRWKNVFIYLILEFLLYFVVAKKNFSPTDAWLFLVLSMTFFGIFGNIQNNLADYNIDRKKKNFTDFNQTAYIIIMIIFLVLAFLFGFTGFYMSFKPGLLYAVISIPVLLSLYNYFLKKTILTGNLSVAFLTAFAIYVPVAFAKNIQINTQILKLLLAMAFWLTLIRELAKDLEDKEFDKEAGYNTLPVLNENISRYVLIFLTIITAFVLFYFKNYFAGNIFDILLLISSLLTIISIYILYRKQYEKATKLYKLWMIIGIFSVIFL